MYIVSQTVLVRCDLGRYKNGDTEVVHKIAQGGDTNVIENLQCLKVICKLMGIYDCWSIKMVTHVYENIFTKFKRMF